MFDESSPEGVLSTQNGFDGQQNPYLHVASFCHSQALHPMFFLACQVFSVQPYSACVLMQSSLCCDLNAKFSSYWGSSTCKCGRQALRKKESDLTSSFALTLQIHRIMTRSLRRRRFGGSAIMAKDSAVFSITLLTQAEYTRPLIKRGRLQLLRRGSNWRNLHHAYLQRVIAASLQRPPAESMSQR